MDIQLNDILVMKKAHPCGEKRWLVLRTGADFRLRCLGCGHEVMTPRHKAEKKYPHCRAERKLIDPLRRQHRFGAAAFLRLGRELAAAPGDKATGFFYRGWYTAAIGKE